MQSERHPEAALECTLRPRPRRSRTGGVFVRNRTKRADHFPKAQAALRAIHWKSALLFGALSKLQKKATSGVQVSERKKSNSPAKWDFIASAPKRFKILLTCLREPDNSGASNFLAGCLRQFPRQGKLSPEPRSEGSVLAVQNRAYTWVVSWCPDGRPSVLFALTRGNVADYEARRLSCFAHINRYLIWYSEQTIFLQGDPADAVRMNAAPSPSPGRAKRAGPDKAAKLLPLSLLFQKAFFALSRSV